MLCGDAALFEGEATMIVARSITGEFAVMEGHAPLLAALDRGLVRIKTETQEEAFAIRSGAMNVNGEGNVTLLVSEAHRPDEIDADWIDQRIQEAESQSEEDEASWLTWLRNVGGIRG
jgi:F-type H+-transporting ATPase subunit epsilon